MKTENLEMKAAIHNLRQRLMFEGEEITTQSWQGKGNPPTMLELLHVSEIIPMSRTAQCLIKSSGAKLPWATIHFEERVSGQPLNPPPSHKLWAPGTEAFFEGGEKFSHSYPERMWSQGLHHGIRYDIADLRTLVEVLRKEPDTRQAYLPIFFPEDLSASLAGDRVPCTLGWHFIVRNGKMDCFYPMRSCDAIRHMHNDFFFANMLTIWLIEQAGLKGVTPGVLHFNATSLHCFKQDKEAWDKGLIK